MNLSLQRLQRLSRAALVLTLPLLGAAATPTASRPAFANDTTRPVVAITAPTSNSTQPALNAAVGTARDASGVTHVATLLYRYADAARNVTAGYYNGTSFSPTLAMDCYRDATSSNGFATWRAALPPLPVGRYAVRAYAVDRAGWVGDSASVTFSLSPTPPPPVSRRMTVLKSLEESINKMPKTDMDATHSAILTLVKTFPDFEASGIADGYNVWARFRDGRVLMIAVDTVTKPPLPTLRKRPTSGARQTAPHVTSNVAPITKSNVVPRGAGGKRMNLPDSLKFHTLSGFGPYYQDAGLAHEEIKAALLRHGYVDGGTGGTSASVAELKGVLGDGVFYVNSHGNGATLRNGTQTFGLFTSTPVTEGADFELREDLANDRLCYMIETNGYLGRMGTHYGVLPNFVRRYWNFSPNSVVYINTCMSRASYADDFVLACYERKAGVHIGWDNFSLVTAGARAARYFFDRLLGDNKFEPENPAQRAFDATPVLADMDAKKLRFSDHPKFKANLKYRSNHNGDKFGLLAPSIRRMQVDELKDELTLTGLFGDDTGLERKVVVEGRELQIKTWEQEKIVATLPRAGVGSSGKVIVSVRGRKSNIVPLTEWTGKFDYELIGHMTLRERFEIPVRFRADVHRFRDTPGEAPHHTTVQAEKEFIATRLATDGAPLQGRHTATGLGSQPVGIEGCGLDQMTWSGSQILTNHSFSTSTFDNFYCSGVIEAEAGQLNIFISATGHISVTRWSECEASTTETGPVLAFATGTQPLRTLPFDSAFNVAPDGDETNIVHPYQNFPDARYTWDWTQISSDSPPPLTPYPEGYAS